MNSVSSLAVGLEGLDGHLIQVEAHLGSGLPSFTMVGLPDPAVREARDRVRAAVASCEIRWPDTRTVVNLSPASLPKTGSGYDLAMAVAILGAARLINAKAMKNVVHIGELGLDGQIHAVRGILPAVAVAVKNGYQKIVVPHESVSEASLVPGAQIIGVKHLADLLKQYGADVTPPRYEISPKTLSTPVPKQLPIGDLSTVRGQPRARYALEVGAAGGHHMLMVGPPGSGKTMLASCLPSILGKLNDAQALEVTAIRSIAGAFDSQRGLIREVPFEAPHHSATLPAMVGGGSGIPRPGAVTLAHHGVLFLDEAPEFSVRTLDSLRQPLENGVVALRRATGQAVYPASFQLIMAANPCPCGNLNSRRQACKCPANKQRQYLARLSGPLLDRIDIQIMVDAPAKGALQSNEIPESSAQVAQRVAQARAASAQRWKEFGWSVNSQIPGPILRSPKSGISKSLRAQVDDSVENGIITMRGADRILRLAWTISDLKGQNSPLPADLGMAMALRNAQGR